MPTPTALPIFVSHSSKDNAYCKKLVDALKDAGADVWFDEQNLGTGILSREIQKQLGQRKIFIVILSKDAFASDWVQDECEWAYQLYKDDRTRVILPITAAPIERDDFSPERGWFFLRMFKRIEGANFQPLDPAEAIQRVFHMLALTPEGEPEAPVAPQPGETAPELVIRGIALRGQKQFDDARQLFERAVKLEPDLANAWFNVGYSRDAVGDFNGALAAWERVVQLEPQNAAAWTNKGSTLLKLQRYQEALEAFETAIRIKDKYVFAWHGKGIALKELNRAAEAIEAYDRALKLDPRFAYALNGKGSALWSLHQLEKALDAFDEALKISPTLALVWRNKASVLLELHRYKEAEEAAQQAINLSPNSSTGWQRRADALRGQGRFHEAETAQAQANRLRH